MTTLTTAPTGSAILSDEMLQRFGQRAPTYDRENRFFQEDFDELRAAGYLKLAVPKDLGGVGCSLAEVAEQQRRLAYRAPATALAINMHIYWTGVAADLRRFGDNSLEWLLREAAAGEVFAAGHGETGNDLPVLLSSSKAERTDGGYRFTGHKMFGSLSRSGPASACMAWTPATRPRRRSSTRSCRATRRATAFLRRGTRWACGPPAATIPSSTARSSRIATSRASCPPGRSIRLWARSSPTRC